MELERRFCDLHGLTVRAETEQPTISGYAAVFNSLSVELWGFREKIAPGAFADTLADDIRALWNHDAAIVLGRTKAGTLTLAEDNTGLRCEIAPPASAAAYVESIRRGDVDQMSFGFRTLKDEWNEDENGTLIRTLLRCKLYEVSPVTFPAYPATSIGVRSEGVDQTYGQIPVIPAQFQRALNRADHIAPELLRAQWQRRARQLQLLT